MRFVIVKRRGKIVDWRRKKNDENLFRDIIIYALSCRTSGVERVLELLSETIFHPKFLPDEVKFRWKQNENFEFIFVQIEVAQAAILNEIDDLKNRRYDPTPILTDMIHAVELFSSNRFVFLFIGQSID